MTISTRVVGIAWAHGDTVLRAGAGIYHTDGQEDDQNLPISNTVRPLLLQQHFVPDAFLSVDSVPSYAEAGGLGVVSPRDLDRNRKDDYVASWTASVQRKLPLNILGNRQLSRKQRNGCSDHDVCEPGESADGRCAIPGIRSGLLAWRRREQHVSCAPIERPQRLFRTASCSSLNYMWSHSINDGSIGGGESDTPQNSFCRSCDKASSDDDVRQVFNLSMVYELPFGAGKRRLSDPGIARTIFGGWTASAIGTAQTGLPVNITIDRSNASVPGNFAISGAERPNYVYGIPLTPAAGSAPQDWINPAAFSTPAAGTFGNLGRNAFRAPRISQLDLALSRRYIGQ